jgi:hypothetical protein
MKILIFTLSDLFSVSSMYLVAHIHSEISKNAISLNDEIFIDAF